MPVSVEMQPIVDELRRLGQCATTDVFSGITYWTDDQLADILEQYRGFLYERAPRQNTLGSVFALAIPSHYRIMGDITFVDAPPPTYTFNAKNNVINIDGGVSSSISSYIVEGTYFNMYEAAAEVWEQKAAQRSGYVDIKANLNTIKMKQEYDHCVQMAAYYRNKTIKRHARVKKN
jgi:hypothetical protein